ncbi:MAG: hypothetical protein ACM31O_14105 [Bacteroidota bacterium]
MQNTAQRVKPSATNPVVGWLIDPQQCSVTPAAYDGDYRTIYRLCRFDLFTVVEFGSDALFVDDEGLLKQPRHFFALDGYQQPLAGCGLMLGTDEDGDSVAPLCSIEEVIASVHFYEVEWHPLTGKAGLRERAYDARDPLANLSPQSQGRWWPLSSGDFGIKPTWNGRIE